MSSTVEQIKNRLSILDVVGTYLKLEKAGSNCKARCPFHNEKTASFFVSPSRESYHCFGCNRGGDIFTFVEEMEGLDFYSALKTLAERAGVELEARDPKADREREALYAALAAAEEYYVQTLEDSPEVIKYLKERGLNDETIQTFRLGFAPAGWQTTYDVLRNKKLALTALIKTGLLIESTNRAGGYYDRFRSRIMFPLRDIAGRTVGFSGRIFGPVSDKEPAKYVNSPQTELYDKSKILYGLSLAKAEIRRHDKVVLVEGQFDLLLAHQAGVKNAVAVSGTALTVDHLQTLKKLTTNVVMAFDADLAGIEAARRGIELCFEQELTVRVVSLPEGVDPADFILKNSAAWREKVENSEHVIDFYLGTLSRLAKDRLDLIRLISERVYPYLSRLNKLSEQEHFIGQISYLTQLPAEAIRLELRRQKLAQQKSVGPAAIKTEPELVRGSPRFWKVCARLFGLNWWQESIPEDKRQFTDLAAKLQTILDQPRYEEVVNELSRRKEELIFEVETFYEGSSPGRLATEVQELLASLQKEIWQERVEAVRWNLSRAEQEQNEISIAECLHQLKELYHQFK